MPLTRIAPRLPLLALSLLLAVPAATAQDEFARPGAVWKLKEGGPKPDANLAWHHENTRNRIGGGRITFLPTEGIVCEFSYTEPPDRLVVGNTYQLGIQGVSTTKPGPPHQVGAAGIGVDAQSVTSPLDGQGRYRERSSSHKVIPPPQPAGDRQSGASGAPEHRALVRVQPRSVGWQRRGRGDRAMNLATAAH